MTTTKSYSPRTLWQTTPAGSLCTYWTPGLYGREVQGRDTHATAPLSAERAFERLTAPVDPRAAFRDWD